MLLQAQINWSEVAKIWGPLGVSFVILLLLIISGARWFKSTLETTITDARTERDKEQEEARKEREYMRAVNEQQANKFIESLKIRDEIQKKGFDEILHELRNNTRRK